MRTRIPFPRKAYNYVVQHPLVAWTVTVFPSFYFLLLQVQGKNIGLVEQGGQLTLWGRILFGVCLTAWFIYALLKAYADKYNEEAKSDGQYVLREMLDSVNDVTKKKLRRFITCIAEWKNKGSFDPFEKITQPKQQVEAILDNIINTFSKLFGMSRDQIGASLMLKTDLDQEWTWYTNANCTGYFELKELLGHSNSTASRLLEGDRDTLFFPDKRIAIEDQSYVSDTKDKNYDNTGSIICRRIPIGQGNPFALAVLSISTYGDQICNEKDMDAIRKIESLILDPFEARIQLELALHYLKLLSSVKSSD